MQLLWFSVGRHYIHFLQQVLILSSYNNITGNYTYICNCCGSLLEGITYILCSKFLYSIIIII